MIFGKGIPMMTTEERVRNIATDMIRSAQRIGVTVIAGAPYFEGLLEAYKDGESKGIRYSKAKASFRLLLEHHMSPKRLFEVRAFRATVERNGNRSWSEANVKLCVGNKSFHEVAHENGMVDALNVALRKALAHVYGGLRVTLVSYSATNFDQTGADARVRATIKTSNGQKSWVTMAVDTDSTAATWQALVDSLEYALLVSRK